MNFISSHQCRKKYLRPLILATSFSVIFEGFIFIIFGVILFPEGSLLDKFIWTVFFCGLGMGGAVGTWINLLVVDRFEGRMAVFMTLIIAILFLTSCDLLCLRLDHLFHYFGGDRYPHLFFYSGLVMTVIGALVTGLLLFTERGVKLLDNIGL